MSVPKINALILSLLACALVLLLVPAVSRANPTEIGSTGLITVPSAETLDAGNICIGVWFDFSQTGERQASILPLALTVGIGTFWEIYASYPNIWFNDQQQLAGKGAASIGTKLRFYGKRNSPIQAAYDFVYQRQVSDDLNINGTNDIGQRLILSLKSDKIGAHLYGGYLMTGSPKGQSYDDEILFGAGGEYLVMPRMKAMLEVTGNTNKVKGQDMQMEAAVGLQYYISPHFTFNLSVGGGITSASPDWRIITGFSTCQGVGTYIRPIPTITKGPKEEKKEEMKPVKIIPLSPLLVKTPAAAPPPSKLDVPVEPDKEEIVIKPYGQIPISPQPAATPVVLPPAVKLEEAPEPESPAEPAPSEGTAPKESTEELEGKAVEYTSGRVNGVTPVYGVEVKAQGTAKAAVKTVAPPESLSVYRKLRFPDTIFESGQSDLSPEVKKALSEVAEEIRKDTTWAYLRIDGYTDDRGSTKYKLDVSLKRAIAVASYLITREGIDPARIFVKGMGSSNPLADNKTAAGRKKNRRFEILLLVPHKKP